MDKPRFERDPHSQHLIEQNKARLKELATAMGYSEVNSLEKLGLSADQTENLMVNRLPDDSGRAFYSAQRSDGTMAKAVLQARHDRYVAADVFSPGLSGGKASSDDWQWDAELHRIMDEAKNHPTR